jgi:peptidoglycan/LPS O-acetylase OafA/YrhL
MLKQRTDLVALGTLVAFTIYTTAFVFHTFADYQSISIPIFFIGILASIYKEKLFGKLHLIAIITIIAAILEAVALNLAHCTYALVAHTLFNYIAIALLIEFFTIKNIRWRVPAFIGAISFDIYLVHNKVLMLLWAIYDFLPLYSVLTITLVSSLVFYLLRTKLLKLK